VEGGKHVINMLFPPAAFTLMDGHRVCIKELLKTYALQKMLLTFETLTYALHKT
jgi:hypothetical protein